MQDWGDWISQQSWTYTDTDLYPEAWKTETGDMLYIRDTLQRQTVLDDFQEPRYGVVLDRYYAPSNDPVELDAFCEEDDAAGLIRALTYPGP